MMTIFRSNFKGSEKGPEKLNLIEKLCGNWRECRLRILRPDTLLNVGKGPADDDDDNFKRSE